MGGATVTGGEQWAQLISRSFVPLAVDAVPETFSGSVDQRPVGTGVSLTAVDCGPSQVSRTPRLARAADSDDLLFAMHLRGPGSVVQDGRSAELRPGAAVLYATVRPYELQFPTSIAELVLQVPRSSVRLSSANLADATARTIDPAHPLLRIMRALTGEILQVSPSLSGEQQSDLGRVAADLLSSILDWGTGPDRGDASTLRAVRGFIHDNLGDPALSPASVAAAHHVSLRHLYSMFERDAITPAAYIRTERLAAARRELGTSPASTVTAVSSRFGFGDATTFTRAFRRQFGTTPDQWRRSRTTR